MTLEDKLDEVDHYLDSVGQRAFTKIAHLSNPVLGRNIFTSKIYHRHAGVLETQYSPLSIIKKYIKYLLNNFYNYLLFISGHFLKLLFFKNKYEVKKLEELYVLDHFYLVDKIIADNKYKEPYFQGMDEVLKKSGKEKVIYSSIVYLNKDLKRTRKFFEILNKDKNHVFLFDYDFLNLFDYVKIFSFIWFYPFYHFSLLQKEQSKLSKKFNEELVLSLDSSLFHPYVKYLTGKKIQKLRASEIKVVSWYENQALHKNFYRGLRESKQKVKIFGCQMFIHSRDMYYYRPREAEKRHHLLPDKILKNGTYYVNVSHPSLKDRHDVGPSLRYAEFFKLKSDCKIKDKKVIALSYFPDIGCHTLNVMSQTKFSKEKIDITMHPASVKFIDDFKKCLCPQWNLSLKGTYHFLESAEFLFTSTSGTSLEAIAQGMSVVVISKKDMLGASYLPEVGRGVIWDFAYTPNEIEEVYEKLLFKRKNSPDELAKIIHYYKENFFTLPTEQKIQEVFEI